MRYIAHIATILALAILFQLSAQAVTLYVSPTGRDAWSGDIPAPNNDRTDGPLASMDGARKRINQIKPLKIVRTPVDVQFASGRYSVTKPVIFTSEDSGMVDMPITYRAAKGAAVWFDGGQRIKGFTVGKDGVWRVKLPEVASGKWYFEQLWVNGQRMMRARTPNNSTLRLQYTPSDDGGVTNWVPLKPVDAEPLKSLSPQELLDTQLIVYQSWERSRHRITSVDADNVAHLTNKPANTFNYSGPNARYHYENARICLDKPGEWFLSRDGILSYIPLPGQKPANTEVVAPVTDGFIQLNGDREKGELISLISFEGLKFTHSQWITPEQGYADAQAAVNVPAVITADGCEKVNIQNCEVARIGTYGIWIRQGNQNCLVQKNYIHDMGAGGVRVGMGSVPLGGYIEDDGNTPSAPGTKKVSRSTATSHITVDNNIIRQGGQIHMDAVGVWVGECGNIRVTHNEIADMYYTGISVGWVWGYGPTATVNNLIEDNHIHHIGKGALSDMAGIYTLGNAPGSVNRGNRIHDVRRWSYGASGIYPDEGSSGWLIENNVCYDVDDGGLFHHYGKENMVRNNIFVDSTYTQVLLARPEAHKSFWFENNIISYEQGQLLSNGVLQAVTSFNKNIYWNRLKQPIICGTTDLAAWQAKGQDKDSLVADPLFMDVAKHDFRLKPNSPAFKIGFKPFPLDQAGVYGDKAWVKLAANGPKPVSELSGDQPAGTAQSARPSPVMETYDNMGPAARPGNAEMSVEGRNELITISSNQAHSGSKSVKITDAPGLVNEFDPHLVYHPNIKDAVVSCKYALYIDEKTNLMVEWRDWLTNPSQYITGPLVSIKQGKLTAGSESIDIPFRQWVVIEMRAGVGKRYSRSWDLTVTLPGAQPRTFANIPCASATLPIVSWVGFISNATEATDVYLDDLSIQPVKGNAK